MVVGYAYLPGSKFQQSVWTNLRTQGGVGRMPAEVVEQLGKEAEQTGLFTSVGQGGLWCRIDRAFADDEMDALVAWCGSVEQAIREHGLKVAP